jgi:hypothetical protein
MMKQYCGNCKFLKDEMICIKINNTMDYNSISCNKWEVKTMNKWEKIAKIVGEENGIELGLGEEFEIEEDYDIYNPYKFTEEGLRDNTGSICDEEIGHMLYSRNKIKKIPRKPKNGEMYWVIDFYEVDCVYEYAWNDNEIDNKYLNSGIIRFTKEEAITLAKKMLEVAKGDN